MGKKKKTLKQKRMAQLRQLKESHGESLPEQQSHEHPSAPSFSYSFSQLKQSSAPVASVYSLKHDLRKTLLVSLSILLALLLLYTLLQTRAFVLPLVSLRY